MSRQNPVERTKMRSAIKESSDEMIKRARKEALEGIQRLEKPSGYAPSELWPGESMDLGGFTVVRAKRKRSKNMGGLA